MSEIEITFDSIREAEYSNESILNGIIHNSIFGSGFGNTGHNRGSRYIGKGARAEVIRSLGFSDYPTESECRSKMKTFKLEAYPEFTFTVHKDLVDEVQNIYKELKALGVQLTKCQGSYCYRQINNPNNKSANRPLSMHSFGCAIDLNHDLNPFSRNPAIKEDDVKRGIVRSIDNPIVQVFAKYGWGWGGSYYDYMHFSKAGGA